MNMRKIASLLFVIVLMAGFAASGAYALPDCAGGLKAAPMRMEDCAGGMDCCGCGMDTTSPSANFDQIPDVSPKFSHDVFFENTGHSKNSLRSIEESSLDDPRKEPQSDTCKFYDLYSDYRI